MKNGRGPKASHDSISGQESSPRITLAPSKTAAQRRQWRLEQFGSDITVLIECDDRRKEAEARLPIRWGF